jgi:hypothetical protein
VRPASGPRASGPFAVADVMAAMLGSGADRPFRAAA